MKRRDALALCGGTLSFTIAGCTGILDDGNPMNDAVPTGWTGHRGDPANTGVRGADAGPGASISMGWEVTHEDILQERQGIDAEDLELPPMAHGITWPVLVEDVVVWTQGYSWLGDDGMERDIVVVAADAEDGSIAWVEPIAEELNTDRWYAPMVHDGSILVPNLVDGNLGLTVHNPDDGSERDRYDWGLPLRANQPVVADGTVFVRASGDQRGRLHAFDVSDGTSLWDVPADQPRPHLPQLSVGADAVFSFDNDGGELVARAVESGEVTWSAPIDLPLSFVTRRPGTLGPVTVSDRGIFAGGSLQQFVHRDVGTLASFDPEQGSARFTHSPPGFGDGDRIAKVLGPDANEEAVVRINEEYFDGEGFTSVNCQPLVVDDRVLAVGWGEVGDASGTILYAVDPETQEATWGVEIGSESYAPVAAGDVVYVSTTEGLEAVSTDGEHLDSLAVESDAHTVTEHQLSTEFAPAVGRGKLFVPAMHGIVAVE